MDGKILAYSRDQVFEEDGVEGNRSGGELEMRSEVL